MRNPDKRVVGLPASLAASPSNIVNKIAHINYANVAIIIYMGIDTYSCDGGRGRGEANACVPVFFTVS